MLFKPIIIVIFCAGLFCACICSGPNREEISRPLVLKTETISDFGRIEKLCRNNSPALIKGAGNHFQYYPEKQSPEYGKVYYSLPPFLFIKYLPGKEPETAFLKNYTSPLNGMAIKDISFRPSDWRVRIQLQQKSSAETVVVHEVFNYNPKEYYSIKGYTVIYSKKISGQWTYLIYEYIDDEWM